MPPIMNSSTFILVVLFAVLSSQEVEAYSDARIFAACVACRSNLTNVAVVGGDPCVKIRSKITAQLTEDLGKVFEDYDVMPSSPSWMYEYPRRQLESGLRTGRGTKNAVNGMMEGGGLRRAADDVAAAKDQEDSHGRDEDRALQGKGVSCRSLCSTYPDCSAWCPNGGRRRDLLGRESDELQQLHQQIVVNTSSHPANLQRGLSDDQVDRLGKDIKGAGQDSFKRVKNKLKDSIDAVCASWLSSASCTPQIVTVGCLNGRSPPLCA